MKAKRQFYSLIFSVFRKVFSVLYFKVKICFSSGFFHFCCNNFLRIRARGAFFCDRYHLMVVLHNVSGISEKKKKKKMLHSRNKALFVMYIIINWSYATKCSIEQEPLKIFKIWYIHFLCTSKHPHAKNYVILPINKGVISLQSHSCFENFIFKESQNLWKTRKVCLVYEWLDLSYISLVIPNQQWKTPPSPPFWLVYIY